MIKALCQKIFNKAEVVVSAKRIRGNHSAGRSDKPGYWWKE